MHTFRGVHSMVCDFETNIFASLSFVVSRGINTLKKMFLTINVNKQLYKSGQINCAFMQIEPCFIELKCSYLSSQAMCSYICSTVVYHVLFFQRLSIGCKSLSIWYRQGILSSPREVCKVLNSFNWYICQFLILFRATSVNDMI